MSDSRYIFICEIENFDIDDYVAHLGWNGRNLNYLKIYTQSGSSLFYLHDEIKDRMFAFRAAFPEELKSVKEFNVVVTTYRKVRAGDENT
jgi:hypothetical protein